MKAIEQIRFLFADWRRITNRRWWRYLTSPFSVGFAQVIVYRLDRAAYLALGSLWVLIRAMLAPLRAIIRPWTGRSEIHYRADIGPGLLILHPILGTVVAASVVIGARLTLTGGNCIGVRDSSSQEKFTIGNNVNLGANAVIIGPLAVGDDVRVGAGAVVVDDVPSGVSVAGVPARVLTEHLKF